MTRYSFSVSDSVVADALTALNGALSGLSLIHIFRPCIPFPRGLGRQPVFSLAACPEVFRCRFRNGHRLSLRCRNIIVVRLQANSELFFFQMRMKMDVNIVRPAEIVVHTAYKKSE